MLITPDRGKRLFGFLMIVAGLFITAGYLSESFRAKSRTSTTEAHVLSSAETFMGIGPLRHYSVNVRYEFFADGVRFEKAQLVDNLPGRTIHVQFDPRHPTNSSLALPDSAPRFQGIIAGLLVVIGLGLALNIWSRSVARFRSTRSSQAQNKN